VVESKSAYLQQIEEFHQARANKLRERDLHVSINKMHIHMSETQLKEEEEEGIKQREEAHGRKN
jgi:DNA-binding HxlR family transcriptional regulator